MTLSENPILIILGSILLLTLSVAAGFFFSELKFTGLYFVGALPVAALILYYITRHPGNALNICIVVSFLAIGASRYTSAPTGLAVDFILGAGLIVAFLHPKIRPEAKYLKNGLILLTVLWSVYCILQIFNPEALSLSAWFYASRGVFIYMLLTVFLGLLYYNTLRRLDEMLILIGVFSMMAALWGLKQYFFGLTQAEWDWLKTGPFLTHILFGKLRVFSFFSDAGQFGAGMGHAAVIATILVIGPFSRRYRILWAIVAAVCLYLMVLSGTRGALAVPVFGIVAFLIISKNFKILFSGLFALLVVFTFLKFSTIGNNIYEIRRLRTALDPEDPSLKVRIENQKKYAQYLAPRPFGGGIGSTGSWGKRFSPNTFLAETPTDSWYVKIWGETGITGLIFYMGMLIFILVKGFFIIEKIRDPQLKYKIIAVYSGYAGIVVASYGNPLLGQLPTGTIIYLSWCFIFLAPGIDKKMIT